MKFERERMIEVKEEEDKESVSELVTVVNS